jgi:hypothetical protein
LLLRGRKVVTAGYFVEFRWCVGAAYYWEANPLLLYGF